MSAVRVCPDKDIECGTTPKLWCSRCPNWSSESGRNTLLDRIAALEAENAKLRADNTAFIVAWKAHLEAFGAPAELAEKLVNETAAALIAARAALKETP